MHRALIAASVVASALSAHIAAAEELRGGSSAPKTENPASAAKSDTHTFVRASLGGSARGLWDVPVLGGEADVGVGIDTRAGSYSLGLSFFAGSTDATFLTLHGTAGLDMAWRVGIVRLGLEPRVGYIGMERITTDRQFGAYTFGAALHGSIDLYARHGTTFALGLQPTADAAIALGSDGPGTPDAAPLYGGRAFVEIRYDAE